MLPIQKGLLYPCGLIRTKRMLLYRFHRRNVPMKRSRYFHLSAPSRKSAAVILALCFVSGLLAGAMLSIQCRDLFIRIRSGFSQSAGFSAFIPTMLPLLASGFAAYVKQPVLLMPIAFWKALSFSYVASGVIFAWSSAGWLVGGLTLFGSFCSLSILWRYWLRHITGEGFRHGAFFLALGAMALIGWVDLLVISPFLSNILTF